MSMSLEEEWNRKTRVDSLLWLVALLLSATIMVLLGWVAWSLITY